MNSIRSLAPLIAVLVVAQPADAAGCKYQTNETDKFTKVETRWTKWNPIAPTWGFSRIRHIPSVSVYSVDGDAQLLLKIETLRQEKHPPDSYELENYLVVSKGAPLIITMADETLLELPALHDVRAAIMTGAPGENDPGSDLYVTTVTAVIEYPLDAGSMETLARQPATRISVTTDNSNFDFEVHKKSINDFATAVECTLSD